VSEVVEPEAGGATGLKVHDLVLLLGYSVEVALGP